MLELYCQVNGWISIRNSNADETHRIERRSPVWCLQFIPGLVGSVPAHVGGKSGPGSPGGNSQGSESNDLLVVGCWDKTLSLYRLNGKSHRIQGERSLRFYPCGLSIANLQGSKTSYMIIAGSNRKVNLYSRDGMRLAELLERPSWIWACAAHGYSDRVLVGSDSGAIDMVKMTFDAVHALYNDRYAFRENLTEVVVHHLVSDRKVRIKCRDYVQRISLYKNKLAVQLSDKVCIYESNPEETLDMHFRLKRERIQNSAKIPCEHMVVASNHVVFCHQTGIALYSFDGQVQRRWSMDAPICYVKMNGGPENREAILVGLLNGVAYKVFLDNPFPLELTKCAKPIQAAALSLNRDKLAVVDYDKTLSVVDLRTQDSLYQTDNAISVCFNTEVDDMLCYSSPESMFVMSGISCREDGDGSTQKVKLNENSKLNEPQEQHINGLAIGFSGPKIFCLHKNAMTGVDVPQGSNMMKQIEMEDFNAAYHVACLGATEPDWRILALRALRANQLHVAKSAFGRLKDSKYLHLIEAIERDQSEGGASMTASSPKATPLPSNKGAGSGAPARRGRGAVTSKEKTNNEPPPVINKGSLDPSWQAEILAYQGHHQEAAKIYARAGRVDEAIRLFTDLRRWNDAKMFAQSLSAEGHGSFDHSQLVRQQAEWLEEINDWKGAATILVSMEKYMQAAKLLADSASPDNIGWQVGECVFT